MLSRKAYAIFFLSVIVLAALLRFPNLTNKGLYYHDEASFMSVGRFYGGIITYVLTNALTEHFSSASIKSKIVDLRRKGASTLEEARPLFFAAMIAAVALFGDKDSVGLLFSAVFSLLTILLLYVFGRSRPPRLSYVIAGLLLGVSIWDVHYSRSALTQSFALFFVSWTVLTIISEYEKRPQRPMNIRRIALLSGLTFNTHYSFFWIPILVACWLAYVEWQGTKAVNAWLRKMLVMAGFMSLSTFVFQIWYEFLYFISLRVTPTDLHRRAVFTYFEQIHNQLSYPFGKATAPYALFLRFLYHAESPPFLIALLLGSLYLAYTSRKSQVNALLLLWILIPVVIWSGFRYSAPRSYLPCLFPAILGTGMCLSRCCRYDFVTMKFNRLRDVVIVGGLVGIVWMQSLRVLPLFDAVSPYKTASERIMHFCREHPGYKMYKPDLGVYAAPLLRYYLGEIIVEEAPPKRRLVITDHFWPLDSVPRVNGERPVLVTCVSEPLDRGMILLDAYHWRMVERYRHGELQDAVCVYKTPS